MSNRLDMKKDTNNRKDKTKYDGPEKPDAYMGNDKQWVFRALVLAFVDMCIIAISFFFALMIRFEFSYSHIPLSFLEGYLHIVPLFMVISLVVFYILRLYHSIWRFASINEFMHIIGAFLVLTVVSVTIHEVYEIKMRLYQVEKIVKQNDILRASKSFLINVKRIDKVRSVLNGRFMATMENGEEVLITRHYAREVADAIKTA